MKEKKKSKWMIFAVLLTIFLVMMGIKNGVRKVPTSAQDKENEVQQHKVDTVEKIKFAPTYTCYFDATDSKGYVSSVLYHVKSATNSLVSLECVVPINSGEGEFKATIGLDPVNRSGTFREERVTYDSRFRIKLTFGDDPRDVITSSVTTGTVTSMTYNAQGGFDITFVYDEAEHGTVHTARFMPNWTS